MQLESTINNSNNNNNTDWEATNAWLTAAEENGFAMWRERERRECPIRVPMMFLLVLLLMDGDETTNNPNNNNPNNSNNRNRLRGKRGINRKHGAASQTATTPLESIVFQTRKQQDERIRTLAQQHSRYQLLIDKNGGTNIERQVQQWAQQQVEEEKDEFGLPTTTGSSTTTGAAVERESSSNRNHPSSTFTNNNNAKTEEERKVFHYPWNSTGFYRGEWTLITSQETKQNSVDKSSSQSSLDSKQTNNLQQQKQQQLQQQQGTKRPILLDAVSLEPIVKDMMQQRKMQQQSNNNNNINDPVMGVFVLPPHVAIQTRDDHNLTSLQWEHMTVDALGRTYKPTTVDDTSTTTTKSTATATDSSSTTTDKSNIDSSGGQVDQLVSSSSSSSSTSSEITLTRDHGRAAFQIFSRSVPGMKELSLVDGFVKLYDSTSPGYSTRKDILLRVRGVLIHSIGRLSLVSVSSSVPSSSSSRHHNVIERSALVLGTATDNKNNNDPHDVPTLFIERQHQRRRRLLANLDELTKTSSSSSSSLETNIQQIRTDALSLYYSTPTTPTDVVAANDNNSAADADAPKQQQQSLYHLPPITSSIQSLVVDEEENEHEDEAIESFAPIRAESMLSLEEEDNEVSMQLLKEDETTREEKNARHLLQAFPSMENDTVATSSTAASSVASRPNEVLVDADSTDSANVENVTTAHTITSRSASSVSRKIAEIRDGLGVTTSNGDSSTNHALLLPPWSHMVIPYPYIRDDADESVRRVRTPVYRRMPPREQLLESNAPGCEFEIQMDVLPVEWTIGSWRNLVMRRLLEQKKLDPSNAVPGASGGGGDPISSSSVSSLSSVVQPGSSSLRGNSRAARAKALQDQALVISMVGTIHSPNCGFTAALNATALRTDWEATTSKAINYSFNMMLVCLAQILILLRQLLHSQSQSAAIRVSLLSIGWQTVLDALICLAHIYLSLAMQPLFTAFASVAFFKLLIFCVIEMKYMAMIMQARNSSNGGQTTEVLRRQVAMLHLRFYVALFGAFLLVFYVGETYRIVYALALYSFWVPQIILNMYTEAKNPLHPYYIYGMSWTRLVVPHYVFAVPNNFLKEVYPDAPTDFSLFERVVLWVGIQAAILVAQSKYGARFMIPARFLPPKFDYSRPLPPSMLPPGWDSSSSSSSSTSSSSCATAESMDDTCRSFNNNGTNSSSSSSRITETQSLCEHNNNGSLLSSRDRHHTTAVTTRNRMRGKRDRMAESRTGGTTTQVETVMQKPSAAQQHHQQQQQQPQEDLPTLDCSICYDVIDVRNRRGYMLAPCDHLFHRDCLIQWMDVKMECPICRTELPAL